MSHLIPELVFGGTVLCIAIGAAFYARHLAHSLDRAEERARKD